MSDGDTGCQSAIIRFRVLLVSVCLKLRKRNSDYRFLEKQIYSVLSVWYFLFCNGLILKSCSSFEIDLCSFIVLVNKIMEEGGRTDLI